MKMSELLELRGTYVCATFNQASVNILANWCYENDVPKPNVTISKLHSTILYSRKNVPNVPSLEILAKQIRVSADHLEIWDTTSGKFGISRALILVLHAPEFIKIHEKFIKEKNATHDFPDYTPHITLSYDIGWKELSAFGKIPKFNLTAVSMISEDLDP